MILMEFVPDENATTEIFGFILAGKMKLKLDTFMQHYVRLVNDLDDRLCPNVAAFLTGEMLFPSKLTKEQNGSNLISSLQLSMKGSNSVVCHQNEDQSFGVLLAWIYDAYHSGKAPVIDVFKHYFIDNKKEVKIIGSQIIKGRTDIKNYIPVKGLK